MANFVKKPRTKGVSGPTEDMVTVQNLSTGQTFPVPKSTWSARSNEWKGTFQLVKEKPVKEPPEVVELNEKKAAKAKKPAKKETATEEGAEENTGSDTAQE